MSPVPPRPSVSGPLRSKSRSVSRERKAAEARHKKNQQDEGFFAKLRRGDFKGATSTGIRNTLEVTGVGIEANAVGVCLGVSGGTWIMGSTGSCLMVSRNSDGNWDLGVSRSPAVSAVGGGMSADLTWPHLAVRQR